MKNAIIKISLVDDHELLRDGLASMLSSKGYVIHSQASNGKEFVENIDSSNLPDIVLMDVNMPVMDGIETTKWLSTNYPKIKIIGLSMYDSEQVVIKMIKNGACAYILKYSSGEELIEAIDSVYNKGTYASNIFLSSLLNQVKDITTTDNKEADNEKDTKSLTPREIDFIKYCCSEYTYKEIADKMNISPRTCDNIRSDVFEKLNIHTRVGLAIYAFKNELMNF